MQNHIGSSRPEGGAQADPGLRGHGPGGGRRGRPRPAGHAAAHAVRDGGRHHQLPDLGTGLGAMIARTRA